LELEADARDLQRQLIKGWATAARKSVGLEAVIDGWLTRRLAHVDAGRSRITVGHDDIAAFRRF
jgi:hypothetical protein